MADQSGIAFPSSPLIGQEFIRTDQSNKQYVYQGSVAGWLAMAPNAPQIATATGTAFPASPRGGQEFYRSDLKVLAVYDANVSAWISTRDGSTVT